MAASIVAITCTEPLLLPFLITVTPDILLSLGWIDAQVPKVIHWLYNCPLGVENLVLKLSSVIVYQYMVIL